MLEVSPNADLDDIKRAYRKLAMQLHPDRNPGNAAAEERFKQISNAYLVLSDHKLRQEYDLRLSRYQNGTLSQHFKEQEIRERKRKAFEVIRLRRQREVEQIKSDYQRLKSGFTLQAKVGFFLVLMVAGATFLFTNWIYSLENFSPLQLLLGFALIITGNIVLLNIHYTVLLYLNLKKKIRFNLHNRVMLGFVVRLFLFISLGVGGAYGLKSYHLAKFPTFTNAKIYYFKTGRSPNSIKVAYRFWVKEKSYTFYLSNREWISLDGKEQIVVKYSSKNPLYAEPIIQP